MDWRSDFTFYFNDLFCSGAYFPTKIELEHIYPSWFITFVGIGVIPNTLNCLSMSWENCFWVALFFYLPLVTNFNQENYEVERNA